MKLYVKYFCMHLKSQLQYKTSFFFMIIGQFLLSFSAFLSIYFLMNRFHSVHGFTFSEVLLCFSVIMMSFSIAECFFRGFDEFPQMLGNGQFDRILVRPRNVILQILGTKIDFSKIGRFVQSLVIFIYAIPHSNVDWSGDKILTLCFMITTGVMVFSGLFMINASLSFFTTDGLEVMNIFTDGGREFGQYPFSIYGEKVLKFFTYIIPLALVQYYPFLYIIGKTSNPLYMAIPLFSILFLIPCYFIWKIGMRHYKSTGS